MLNVLEARGYENPPNFSHAKKIMKKIYFEDRRSYLKGCKYSYDINSCMDKTIVDSSSCDIEDENLSIKWVRIIPAVRYGENLKCMNEKICINMQGKPYKGEMCCRKTSPAYLKMEADLFNIVPVLSNIENFSKNIGEDREGDVARVYLYFYKYHKLSLSDEEIENFIAAHKRDEVSLRECEIHESVVKIQGRENPWMISACETLLKSEE